MTTKSLIEELQQFHPDTPVLIHATTDNEWVEAKVEKREDLAVVKDAYGEFVIPQYQTELYLGASGNTTVSSIPFVVVLSQL